MCLVRVTGACSVVSSVDSISRRLTYPSRRVSPQSKGEELDSLLYDAADVSRHMDRGEAAELEQRTTDLRNRWTALRHLIGM